eukprot:9705907-Prorocentrum_lima.AAC.1
MPWRSFLLLGRRRVVPRWRLEALRRNVFPLDAEAELGEVVPPDARVRSVQVGPYPRLPCPREVRIRHLRPGSAEEEAGCHVHRSGRSGR